MLRPVTRRATPLGGMGETRAAPFLSVFRAPADSRMITPRSLGVVMDTELVAMLARAAGLDRALAEYPDDVAAAAEQALGNRGAIAYPTDPAAEPWPPMRAGVAL